MANIGQTIIIRTDIFDLPQDMGLLAAQVAHIHAEIFRVHLTDNLQLNLAENMDKNDFTDWIHDPYIFVKKVPNFEALSFFQKKAEAEKLPVSEWNDIAYVRLSPTMKEAFQVTVGISIGPSDADKIRTVVGDLPLL